MSLTDRRPRALPELLAGLPSEPQEAELLPAIRAALTLSGRKVVAIDDDPTGVQTVHDVPVLLDWDAADLRRVLAEPGSVVFLLTNSRSLPAQEAAAINRQLAADLASGPQSVVLASRSDSTLRGHYPAEVLALAEGTGAPFDGHLILPQFFEGGRYTIQDTHWVATPDATSQEVVPASATPFARDAAFGFSTAFLPAWVEEKSGGRWRSDQVQRIPLNLVRTSAGAVVDRLMAVSGGVPVVVNAAGYGDLAQFTLGLLQAEAQGKRFLYRTAASFVRVRSGIAARSLLTAAEVYAACAEPGAPLAAEQGLVIVGSYVPASTEQLHRLLAAKDLPVCPIEVDVERVLAGVFSASDTARLIDRALQGGQLPVLLTSRQLVTVAGERSLAQGKRITNALVEALTAVRVRPRYIVTKGGVTSHEIARQGAGARGARALGQIVPGVPVWRLAGAVSSHFAGVPHVVFPGNVGSADSLLQVIRHLT